MDWRRAVVWSLKDIPRSQQREILVTASEDCMSVPKRRNCLLIWEQCLMPSKSGVHLANKCSRAILPSITWSTTFPRLVWEQHASRILVLPCKEGCGHACMSLIKKNTTINLHTTSTQTVCFLFFFNFIWHDGEIRNCSSNLAYWLLFTLCCFKSFMFIKLWGNSFQFYTIGIEEYKLQETLGALPWVCGLENHSFMES